MRGWGALFAVGGVFIVFCALFSAATPYRQSGVLIHQRGQDGLPAQVLDVGAPDERQHANYVAHIIAGKGLPVFNPKAADLYESYQSHQPPAYYVLAAVWCRIFGIDPVSAQSGVGLRHLNTFLGLATLAAIAFGAKWTFPNSKFSPIAATLVLLPMNIALHSAVGNDPLLISMCTWVLALLGLCQTEGWNIKRALIIAILTSIALLTKTTAIALLPCLALAVAFALKSEERSKVRFVPFLALLLPLVVAIPWWMRNTALYGDPLALKAFGEAFVGSPKAADFVALIGPSAYWLQMVTWWTARSAVGVFGYMDIFMFESLSMAKSDSIYCALLFLLAIPICSGVVLGCKVAAKLKETRGILLIWASFVILICLFFVRFNSQYFQGQARYLYPAIGPVAWAFGFGLFRLLKRNVSASLATSVILFIVLNISALNEMTSGFARRTLR